MGAWSYYFLCKLVLVTAGVLQANLGLNLPFAVFTAVRVHRLGARVLKQLVAIPLGIGLLYHDAQLPPLTRLLEQAGALASFSTDYLLDLALRFIDLRTVLLLLGTGGLLWVLSHRLRLSALALLGVLVSPVLARFSDPPTPVTASTTAGSHPLDLDGTLDAFYQKEKGRKVLFPVAAADDALPYDIVLLHLCSLAWDDLDAAGLREHPFLRRLDLRFSRFSAAASYSGPAAIRVLRSACGQPSHDGLYQPADASCLLMSRLEQAGFELQLAMNHDGRFGDFLIQDVRRLGGVSAPLHPLEGIPAALRAFDGSRVHDDYAVLEDWWKTRRSLESPRAALYYNSATLHDGNKIPGEPRLTPLASYRVRARRLFDELERFFALVEASDRRMVVVLIPEHGANVRGDRTQISGLREVPSPAITQVPAGIALLGGSAPRPTPVDHEPASSHLAVAQLLAQFIARNPFAPEAPSLNDYAATLAVTPAVAENEGVIVIGHEDRWWLRDPDHDWDEYRP